MRYLIILSFLLLFVFGHSQERSEFELLGVDYSFEFEKSHNRFTICTVSDSESICKKYSLNNDDAFRLPEMQERLNTYFSELVNKMDSFDSLEIKMDVSQLKEKKMDTLLFSGHINLPAYLIQVNSEDSTLYEIQPLETLLQDLGEMSIKYENDISAADSTFERAVKDSVITKLQSGSDKFKKGIKDTYEKAFASFYKEKVLKTESYTYLTTEGLIKKGDTTDVKTSFIWHYLLNNKIFHLKTTETESTNEPKIYGPYALGISESEFKQKVFAQHDQFEQNETNQLTLEKIRALVKTPIQEAIRKRDRETQKEMELKIADSLDNIKTMYSGQLTLSKEFNLTLDEDKKKGPPKTFKVDSASISFFNNRADHITIMGKIDNVKHTSINRLYSLHLREFNNQSGQINRLIFKVDGQRYKYNYRDVFKYESDGNKFNYAIKNEEVKLEPDKPLRIKQRDLFDYFTGIFFSDFLGLNNNNQNGLIIAEAQMRFPFHFRTTTDFLWIGIPVTFFDNITLYGSANLFSGFENNNRKIILPDIAVDNPSDFNETNPFNFTTDNFNLLLNNNIDAGIRVSAMTIEWKGASTFVHFRYGLRFLRTGVEYNLLERTPAVTPDDPPVETLFETRDFQVFTVGHEVETSFEIRPQSNIGADLTVGLNWFGATGTSKNDIKFNTTNNSPNIKVMTNIYALVNPNSKKSGLFFRLGGHYDTGNYKLFPQMMLGYATNLTSFINRAQSKNNN
jgi:hypothetical protein